MLLPAFSSLLERCLRQAGWILPLAICYSYSSVFQADPKVDHIRFICNYFSNSMAIGSSWVCYFIRTFISELQNVLPCGLSIILLRSSVHCCTLFLICYLFSRWWSADTLFTSQIALFCFSFYQLYTFFTDFHQQCGISQFCDLSFLFVILRYQFFVFSCFLSETTTA